MQAAVLYTGDRVFAGRVWNRRGREPHLIVADNEPYFVSDETDYTIPHHAESRFLLHVEIEIRQDLVADEAGPTGGAGGTAPSPEECRRRHPSSPQETPAVKAA